MTPTSVPPLTPGALPTTFVTVDNAEQLKAALELALEELDEVAGGISVKTIPVCQCVN